MITLVQIRLTGWDVWIILVWLFQLAVGCGAGYAAYRLWRDRANQFARSVMIHLHATMVIALASVVMLFLSGGVRLTWKFTYGLFAFMALWNAVSLPLILFVIRGPKGTE